MKILVFAPHSAIWIHAFPEALVAEAAAQHGHELIYVGCGGVLNSHCISMSGYGVPFQAPRSEKARVCRLCRKNKEIIRTRFGFSGIDLADLATDDDWSFADEFAAMTTQDNCLDRLLTRVEVGRIALYELVLQSKKSELVFSATEWQRYMASLKNTIVVLRGVERLLTKMRPDRAILYNALYSVNRIVCRLCELRGIPQYFLHAGGNLLNRLSTVILARGHAFSYYGHLRERWGGIQDRPGPARGMELATDHFLEVARGRSLWAYSSAPKPGIDLKRIFNIHDGQKVISATMSSDDERRGGELLGVVPSNPSAVFSKQLDWMKALISYVDGREDVSLIIRVHPREFPNKREGVMSEHVSALKGALTALPKNVRLNWPTDNISLYDLANVTDVFTNAWSSAGKEMAWLGLPVVLYSHELTLYPADLNLVGTTEKDYFRKIEQALRDGWDPQRIRRTYRWCAMEYGYSSLDISESFSRSEHRGLFGRGAGKLMRIIAPYRTQRRECNNRAPRLSCSDTINAILSGDAKSILDLERRASSVSETEETRCLKREVGRLVNGLYGSVGRHHEHSLAGKLHGFASSPE